MEAAIVEEVEQSNDIELVGEFRYLLAKSKSLFDGIKGTPVTFRNWSSQFQRTFDVYAKLWKFQKDHRLAKN